MTDEWHRLLTACLLKEVDMLVAKRKYTKHQKYDYYAYPISLRAINICKEELTLLRPLKNGLITCSNPKAFANYHWGNLKLEFDVDETILKQHATQWRPPLASAQND